MSAKKFVRNDNNLAIAYYRYSSAAQNEASIEQQRESAHKYAEARGFTIVQEYEDAGISGRRADRPGFQLMLSEVGDIKPSTLILWKTDRLARDQALASFAKKMIRDAGCDIEYVAETTPDDTPEGRLIEGIFDSLAEFYSSQLSVNTTRGMLYNASRARFNGHNLLGYRKSDDGYYEIDPDTAPIVRRIFAMYAEGKAMAEIAKDLNDQGLRTLKGGPFTINGLRHILQNDRYIGVYRYSDITIPDGMPPIVERETFDKAQEQLALNKRQGSQRANGIGKDDAPRYWLTGKLYCGMCGNTMHGVHGTGKHGDKYYYACKNRLKHKCQKRNVRKEDIEALVVSVLREILHDDENTVSIAADISAYYKKNYVDTSYLDSLR
ncbi:MAG: recombinase family protein, partial [Atopobiaceae bacterium]|nr:recombinase family protein [Atopobiaceae bacterium]